MAKAKDTKPVPSEKEISAQKPTAITSAFLGLFSAALQNMPVATPEFFQRHAGKSFWDIAEEMMHDSHIQSVFRSRRAGVISRSWEIIPITGETGLQEQYRKRKIWLDSEKQRAIHSIPEAKAMLIAEFVRDCLGQIPNFEHTLAHLLEAIPYGHSVIEIMWKSYADSVRIETLRTRRADRFTIANQGRLQLLDSETGQPKELPDRKFICHRHDPQDDAPYARPLLFSIYWPWYFKKHAMGFWMILAEKFGVPSVVGKYPPHFTDEDVQALVRALTNLQQDSVAAVPQDTEINTELAKVSVGEKGNFFRELLDFCNAEISKAVLGGTLTQEIGETGSYAAAKTHQEVRQEIVADDARLLMTTIDATLVRWLTDFNYGPEVPAPAFQIDYKQSRGTPEFATTLKTLQDMGYAIPKRFVAETFGLPEAEEDEDVLEPRGGGQGLPFEERSPFEEPPDAS